MRQCNDCNESWNSGRLKGSWFYGVVNYEEVYGFELWIMKMWLTGFLTTFKKLKETKPLSRGFRSFSKLLAYKFEQRLQKTLSKKLSKFSTEVLEEILADVLAEVSANFQQKFQQTFSRRFSKLLEEVQAETLVNFQQMIFCKLSTKLLANFKQKFQQKFKKTLSGVKQTLSNYWKQSF